MSDAPAAEGGKKKGGKMPIVLVLAAVLGAGGYFGMQSRAPKEEKSEPEPELGAIVPLDPEFIVNLREREFFLRASIAIQLDKHAKTKLGAGGDASKGGPAPEMIALRDAVQERLASLSVQDLRRQDFYERLRRLLAYDANKVLKQFDKEEDSGKKRRRRDDEEDEEKEKKHDKPLSMATVTVDPSKFDYPEFDSEEGPVLKVYITGFATQRE